MWFGMGHFNAEVLRFCSFLTMDQSHFLYHPINSRVSLNQSVCVTYLIERNQHLGIRTDVGI